MPSCLQETRNKKQYMLHPPVCSTCSTFKRALPPQNHTTTKLPHKPSSSTLPPPYQNMPLQQAVSYQAFCEITNFIHNNGDDWDEFCTKTAHTTREAKKTPNLSKKQSKHKIAEDKGLLAPEPLLQENPHRFVLFPIHHADIWRMYKKAKASSETLVCLIITIQL